MVFEDACPSDPTYPLLRYLGDFVPESVVLCAFGAGFGHNPPPEAWHGQKRLAIISLLQRFDQVALASRHDLQTLRALTGIDGLYAPDPLFLLTADEWRSLAASASAAVPKQPYTAWMIRSDPRAMKAADMLHGSGLPTIGLFWGAQRRAKQPLSALEWLALIAGSRLVVSDDYYAVALSLIMGRPTLVPAGDDAKLVRDLLHEMGLEQLLLHSFEETSFEHLRAQTGAAQSAERVQKLRTAGQRCLAEMLALSTGHRSSYVLPSAVSSARKEAEQIYAKRRHGLQQRLHMVTGSCADPAVRGRLAARATYAFLDEVLACPVPIRLYYEVYRAGVLGNAGDLLSPFIVEAMSGRNVTAAHYDDPHKLVAVGSAVDVRQLRSGGRWWGTGAQHGNLIQVPGNVFHAVRGPLTRKILMHHGYKCPDIYGDPALLLPQFYPCKASHSYRLGIVCHFDHRHMLCIADDVRCISIMRRDWDVCTLIDEICSCEQILSSSLHGIIIAHAYGIPAQWFAVEGMPAEAPLKYLDYFSSVGMPAQVPLLLDTIHEISVQTVRHCARSVDLRINLQALKDAFPYEELGLPHASTV